MLSIAAVAVAVAVAAGPLGQPASPSSPPAGRPAPRAAGDAGVVPSASALAPAPSPSLEQAGEVKELELDERRARAVYRIKTAISIPAVVEFPEAFASPPACGDCADASKPAAQSAALFALQAEPGGNFLVVKPRLYPGLQADGSSILAADFVTTITVRLQSLTLTLQVELVEDKRQADARVRFVLPNRAAESRYVTESIAKAKAALEAEYAARVEAGGAEQLLRAFLEPHECRTMSPRQRNEDIVLELRELCRFGRRLFIRFALENRGRALFVVGDVAAGVADGEVFTSSDVRWLTTVPELQFQAVAEGVASFEVDDKARALGLRISERGGRARSVALHGFGF